MKIYPAAQPYVGHNYEARKAVFPYGLHGTMHCRTYEVYEVHNRYIVVVWASLCRTRYAAFAFPGCITLIILILYHATLWANSVFLER